MKENTDGLTEPVKNTEYGLSSTSVQEKENSEASGNKIIEVDIVYGTPFRIVKTAQGSFIAVGNKRVTELQEYIDCKEMIDNQHWDLIVSLITIITEGIVEEMGKNEPNWDKVKEIEKTAEYVRKAGDKK